MAVTWVAGSEGKFPAGAFIGGNEANGESTYIIRAGECADTCPGKLTPSHGCGYISYNDDEHQKKAYEVLVAPADSLKWAFDSRGHVPGNAVPGGITCNQETLYVGRTSHEGALVTGKIHPSNGVLYFPYGGKELNSSTYEVLVEPIRATKEIIVEPVVENVVQVCPVRVQDTEVHETVETVVTENPLVYETVRIVKVSGDLQTTFSTTE